MDGAERAHARVLMRQKRELDALLDALIGIAFPEQGLETMPPYKVKEVATDIAGEFPVLEEELEIMEEISPAEANRYRMRIRAVVADFIEMARRGRADLGTMAKLRGLRARAAAL